jgi:hypothetical protein
LWRSATSARGLTSTGAQQLVACYAVTVRVEPGCSWGALIQEPLDERLQECPHELSLGGGGLLGFRIGLEFAYDLLAGGYLVGRRTLSANALGESELYLVQTLPAVVAPLLREENHEQGHRHRQNAPDSQKSAPRPTVSDALPLLVQQLQQALFTLAFDKSWRCDLIRRYVGSTY